MLHKGEVSERRESGPRNFNGIIAKNSRVIVTFTEVVIAIGPQRSPRPWIQCLGTRVYKAP